MAQPAQLTRRMVGVLNTRLPELQLQAVPDARDPRWVKWRLATVLRVLIVSMTAGCISLLQALRVVRRLYLTEQIAGFQWDHLRTVLRVESQTYAHGRLTAWQDRYFVSSLPSERLTPAKWLRLIRLMWGVENAVHCTLDKSMREDQHPWIESNPRGTLVIALLRRIAYNLLALLRSVTMRGEHTRDTPWKTVMRWIELALLTAGPSDVARLRPRTAAAAGAS